MCWEEDEVQGSSEVVLFPDNLLGGVSVAEHRAHCPAWAREAEWEMQECKNVEGDWGWAEKALLSCYHRSRESLV